MKRNGIALGLVCALFACDATEPAPTEAESAEGAIEQTAVGEGGEDPCFETMVRARQCSEQYVPALVAARVELDRPEGIAAQDAEHGRQALVEQARAEWAADSQDDPIRQSCSAMQAAMPAEQLSQVQAAASDCLARSGCDEFVACIMPIMKNAMDR